MTDPVSAERLAERVSGKSCQGYPKWLIPLLCDAQRNALEAAATRLEKKPGLFYGSEAARIVRAEIPNDPEPEKGEDDGGDET